jgi:2-iminoacetate synthase ThiH
MTREQALELSNSNDLTAIGMQADAERARRHPDGFVTYCLEDCGGTLELTFLPGGNWLAQLDEVGGVAAIRPKAAPGLMAVDYLKLVALCRLYLDVENIEVDWRTVGPKVAQLALRFGANDFGQAAENEEEIRRTVRDAGFVPKKRLAHYGALAAF